MNLWSVLQSGVEFNKEAVDWNELAKLLVEHKLAGYFFQRWGDVAPQEIRPLLRTQWAAQRMRNEIHINEFDNIRSVFRHSGMEAIGLKGVALVPLLYPDLGSRYMSDIDVLVQGVENEDIVSAMAGLGYTRMPDKKWWANDFKLLFAKETGGLDLTVEFHSRLFAKEPKGFTWRADPEDPSMLMPAHMVIHLCGHLAYQHTFLKAFWLLDLDLYARAFEYRIDWDQVERESESLGLERSVASALAFSRERLGTPVPEHIKVSSVVERLIDQNFESKGSPLWSRYVLKHLVKDSLGDSIGYDIGWLKNKLFGSLSDDDSKDEPPAT
ncbi:MAG: nucleotidyltransferase family protein [Bdellovibrionia bacterium]